MALAVLALLTQALIPLLLGVRLGAAPLPTNLAAWFDDGHCIAAVGADRSRHDAPQPRDHGRPSCPFCLFPGGALALAPPPAGAALPTPSAGPLERWRPIADLPLRLALAVAGYASRAPPRIA